MSKKKKTVFALAEDFQAIISILPKLESFVKTHKEIAGGYQKYRKNGGAAIPGIEKHVGIKEQNSPPTVSARKTTKVKTTKESSVAKKTKKKAAL